MRFHFMVNNISYFLVYPLTTGLIPQIEETIKMLLHNRKIHWGVVHTGFHAENLVNKLWKFFLWFYWTFSFTYEMSEKNEMGKLRSKVRNGRRKETCDISRKNIIQIKIWFLYNLIFCQVSLFYDSFLQVCNAFQPCSPPVPLSCPLTVQ